MSIGTPKDLLNASFGKKARDTTKPPARMVSMTPAASANPQMGQSRARREALGLSMNQLGQLSQAEVNLGITGGQYGATARESMSAPMTNTFANILAGGGRSGSGKYSGFNTGAELDDAISGSTFDLVRSTPQTLRSKATPYLEQISNMRSDASRQASNVTMAGVTGKIPAVPMGMTQFPEGSVYNTKINPLRQYNQQLATFETEASMPAEEYLQTAQQIESTPMADLARLIATQRFGMDRNLAAGKFSDVGNEFFRQERDREYQQNFGMGFEQYDFEQDRIGDLASGGSKEAIANATAQIETITGLRITTLSEMASQTPIQIFENLSRTYQIPDPNTGEMIEANGAGIVEALRESIGSGNNRGLQDIYETLMSSPGSEGMALLIAALAKQYVGGPQKTLQDLQDLAIFE